MGKITFYDEPTMVKFLDIDSDDFNYFGGIAYHDEIICGCCGGTVNIKDLYDNCADLNFVNPNKAYNNPLIELSWVDVSKEIKMG